MGVVGRCIGAFVRKEDPIAGLVVEEIDTVESNREAEGHILVVVGEDSRCNRRTAVVRILELELVYAFTAELGRKEDNYLVEHLVVGCSCRL